MAELFRDPNQPLYEVSARQIETATGRTIESRSIGDRNISGRSTTTQTSPLPATPDYLAAHAMPFVGKPGGSPFLDASNLASGVKIPGLFPDTTVKTPQNTGTSNGPINNGPIYGDSDPFRIAADIFSKFYSQGPTDAQPQAPVVVGDASLGGSSGGSSFGIILVLGLLGIGGYFLYKRYAQ